MIFLSDAERAQLRAQHRQERDKRIYDRIKAVLLYPTRFKDWVYVIQIILSIIFYQYILLTSLSALEPNPPYLNKIQNISRRNGIVYVNFENKNIYAHSAIDDNLFPAINGVLQLPVYFSDETLACNIFYIYEKTGSDSKYLGDIVFNCISRAFYLKAYGSEISDYITIGKCSFAFPEAADTFDSLPKPQISSLDKAQLWNEMIAFRNNAAQVFSSKYSQDEIKERCILITQFIWSLNPSIYSSTKYENLGLMDKIRGLREKKLGILCQGLRDLFTEIASVLMPEVRVRKVNAFRWHYPDFHNITVNSHALLEVAYDNRWWIVDPTHRFYLTTVSDQIIDSARVRFLRENNRLSELKIVHIPTNHPQTSLFSNPDDLCNIFSDNYWCYFKWFNYYTGSN